MEQYLDLIAGFPLFRGLSRGELSHALRRLSPAVSEYQKGSFFLHEGDRVTALWMVLSGAVSVIKEDFWGNRNILTRLEPGDLFAETYACAGKPLQVSVLADADGRALRLEVARLLSPAGPAQGVQELLVRNLLSVLAEKNLMLNEKLTHVTQRSTRAKLLSFLSAEARRQGSPSFSIGLNRQGLADYLSVDRSAMSSELGRMRREGLLAYERNRFALL